MKIGLFCLTEHFEGSVQESIMEQLRLVELADQLGFDEAWFGEHHFNGFSVIPDPCSMIAFAAARTGCIRLGTAGFLAPFYHPVRLAESIAVLDNLSGGRINAGFAKGGFAPDTKHFSRDPDNLRNAMFETTEAVDALLHTKTTSYNGAFVSFENTTLQPKPLQKRIPFFVATFANPDTIRFAARQGYGLLMSQGASLDECLEAQKLYRSIAGVNPEIVLMRVFCVADSYDDAYRIARPSIDHFVKSMRAASSEIPAPKWNREKYNAILLEREAFFDGQKFFDNAIIGTYRECLKTIQTIQNALPDIHLVLKPSSSDPSQNRTMLNVFNTHIRPHI
ncbi:LLM class flavin-dependent oxidoreductase [Sulfuricurvum sp.]|uniref:LLM class flavin-dependent oxidoreductase n=1 Tax=Sulfuricurvum sp. TaxID=2025608 RepID=UPI00262858AF|nr:LLM class flavin-dependent oxidoreductase [Sulfuricurvum sp.]MDD2267272.1 LLM class flavin-dependent oxidoreductase [Sulfuricurvum sp.]MDD2785172.1 LLM class flavin-dependent oxidoreductase [Sulfuricurvum sp.]HZF71275.1 LLM class flavin-dependent oxidoreductase [Sulfuricurvum sp.]